MPISLLLSLPLSLCLSHYREILRAIATPTRNYSILLKKYFHIRKLIHVRTTHKLMAHSLKDSQVVTGISIEIQIIYAN